MAPPGPDICRAVAFAPPLPAPMLGQMRTSAMAIPVQLTLTVAVVSATPPAIVSTLPNASFVMLKLQLCAFAVLIKPVKATNASTVIRIIGTSLHRFWVGGPRVRNTKPAPDIPSHPDFRPARHSLLP